MDRQSSLRGEAETKLKDTENSLKNIQAKSKQLINALQAQLEEQTNARVSFIPLLYYLKGYCHHPVTCPSVCPHLLQH